MRATTIAAASLLGIASCGGKTAPTKTPEPTPVAKADEPAPAKPTPAPDVKPDPKPVPPPPPAPVDHEPEWTPPAWTKVGVGQTIHFGTDVIDQDADETSVTLSKKPASATYDQLTQTVSWTPTKADLGTAAFQIAITQKGKTITRDFAIEVVKDKQPAPVAEEQSAVIETLLMIRQPGRLAQVNKDWPLDKLLLLAADHFKWQFTDENRAKLDGKPLDKKQLFAQFLTGLSVAQNNPRLDPKSPKFDKKSFGDPSKWKIVAFRPRIDRQWTELRVVYQAVDAPEPMFAMWRLRPTVEYVPALPRPEEEHVHNNKVFLGMVAKHLMKDGGPNPAFAKDQVAHGKAVSALMTELLTYDDSKSAPYKRGFAIGIAMEGRMGGGSARNPDGSYKSGDAWGWSIMKPFQTQDAKSQAYVNPTIPGFWTFAVPTKDGHHYEPKCSPRFTKGDPNAMKGYEVLCRPTLGFVDLPDVKEDGTTITNSRREATNLFLDYKQKWIVEHMPLEDPRRDVGEENGMTCSQCHIRNFGMHDYRDAGATDPSAGPPKTRNHAIKTLNFQIIPGARWEEFTLEFLKHQECRAIQNFEESYGPDSHKGLSCALAPK